MSVPEVIHWEEPPPPIPLLTFNLPLVSISKVFVFISKDIYGGKYWVIGPPDVAAGVNFKGLSTHTLPDNKVLAPAVRGYIIISHSVCVVVGEYVVVSSIVNGFPVTLVQDEEPVNCVPLTYIPEQLMLPDTSNI